MFSLAKIRQMNERHNATHKVHYAETFMRGVTRCGRNVFDLAIQDLEDDWSLVTCKICLNRKGDES